MIVRIKYIHTETNVSRQTMHNCKDEDAIRADKNYATQLEITLK